MTLPGGWHTGGVRGVSEVASPLQHPTALPISNAFSVQFVPGTRWLAIDFACAVRCLALTLAMLLLMNGADMGHAAPGADMGHAATGADMGHAATGADMGHAATRLDLSMNDCGGEGVEEEEGEGEEGETGEEEEGEDEAAVC
eukprot:1888850-Rhodomonas_salina.4